MHLNDVPLVNHSKLRCLKLGVLMKFLLSLTGVRCVAPTALMARTARTTAVTVSTASAMLSQGSACVTLDFMASSKSKNDFLNILSIIFGLIVLSMCQGEKKVDNLPTR